MKHIALGLITAASLLVAVPAFACDAHGKQAADETTASTTAEEGVEKKQQHSEACGADCDCKHGENVKAEKKGAGKS